MAVTAGTEPVGREVELSKLRAFRSDVANGPCGIVIRGEAGIGKTLLWRAALDAAAQAGVRVLATRSVEAEMPLPLGGLGDLIQAGLVEVEGDLAGPQRATLAFAAGLEAGGEQPDQLSLLRAFTSYVRALSRRAPTIVAVDDVQWLDRPSVRVLGFAVRRLGDAPVGVLVTQRGDAEDPLGLAQALEERLNELRLGPLSVGALHHLVRSRLGMRIGRPQIARVHAASGGNPMFALEFLSRVREAYDRGMSTDESIAHGIKSTAGVVTSAAFVMVGVFAIFATLSMLILKQFGVGLAAAILIDATIIRAILLPASMKLLGDWNWYLPKWLEWLPYLDRGDTVEKSLKASPSPPALKPTS